MIWEWLVTALAGVLTFVFDVLPTLNLDALFHAGDGVARAGAREAAKWNAVAPVREMLQVGELGFKFAMPGMAIYAAANWVYRHLPHIFGWGPSGG